MSCELIQYLVYDSLVFVVVFTVLYFYSLNNCHLHYSSLIAYLYVQRPTNFYVKYFFISIHRNLNSWLRLLKKLMKFIGLYLYRPTVLWKIKIPTVCNFV